MAHPLTHLTHGIPTRRPFHPAKTASDCQRFASGNVTKAECPDWKRAYAPSTAHISPFTARCSGCWVAIGALVASAPGVQAEEGQQRYTSRTTPHVTCVTRHAQNAKPTSRCRTVAPWSTTMRRQTAIQSAIDGFICHTLGPVEDQS